jgi:hypothetical protein
LFEQITNLTYGTIAARTFRLVKGMGNDIRMRVVDHDGQRDAPQTWQIVNIVTHKRHLGQRNA